jgi:hypothetical protein
MTTVARWRRTVGAERRLATAALVGLAVAVVAAVDPHTSGRYPTCPWHAMTGTWCPGCGGLRAVHDLTHGHLVIAMHENVLVVLLAPSLLLWWLVVRLRRGGKRPERLVLSARGTVLIAGLLVVFAVVRNLAIGAALAP